MKIMKKKLLVFSLMLLLVLSALPTRAEGEAPSSQPVSPYGLGYVTLPPKSRAPTFDMTTVREPVLGGEGIWSVTPVNDPGENVEFRFTLADYEAGMETLPAIYETEWSASNTFSYTFYQAKQYCLFVYMQSDSDLLMDFFIFSVADAPDAVTVESRVSEIVAECRAAVSGEYATALWLHDWITHHAYYDLTYSNYGPDGILFHGTGVCDSYSKLYQMLLTEAGITSMRLTGTANGGDHAWNAVRIDGVWCQIDVTWDDPSGSTSAVSGSERYDYFGLNDALMSMDHTYDPPVSCDSLANYYPYRTQQHRTWMYHVWAEIEDNLAGGMTSFDVDTQGIIVARVTENGYSYYSAKDYVDKKSVIAAALMSMDEWTLPDGTILHAEFTYDGGSNTMHCEVREEADPCADGHDWGEMTIEWTGEGIIATRVCSRDEGHVETAQADFALAKAPTRDEPGETVYTAVFESDPLEPQQATFADIPALRDLNVLCLPNDLTAIGGEAFMNTDCEAVIIPDGCVSIGARAFAGCGHLIYIRIPASVTDMAEDALAGCEIVRVDRPGE